MAVGRMTMTAWPGRWRPARDDPGGVTELNPTPRLVITANLTLFDPLPSLPHTCAAPSRKCLPVVEVRYDEFQTPSGPSGLVCVIPRCERSLYTGGASESIWA